MSGIEETVYIDPVVAKAENEDLVGTLNNLVEVNRDGMGGYEMAADAAENGEYAALFREYSAQRGKFVHELSSLINDFGGDAAQTGTLFGSLHHAWMGIKAAVTQGDGAILAECDRGDEVALSAYQDAMSIAMSESVRDVIRHQLSSIRLAHERVHALNSLLN